MDGKTVEKAAAELTAVDYIGERPKCGSAAAQKRAVGQVRRQREVRELLSLESCEPSKVRSELYLGEAAHPGPMYDVGSALPWRRR